MLGFFPDWRRWFLNNCDVGCAFGPRSLAGRQSLRSICGLAGGVGIGSFSFCFALLLIVLLSVGTFYLSSSPRLVSSVER